MIVNGQCSYCVRTVSGIPLFNSSGEFEGYRGVSRDITSRKKIERKLELAYADLIEAEARGRLQAEQALRDSEMFLRTSLNALPEQLAILNQSGSILEANTAWREYAGKGTGNNSGPEAGGIGWYFGGAFCAGTCFGVNRRCVARAFRYAKN